MLAPRVPADAIRRGLRGCSATSAAIAARHQPFLDLLHLLARLGWIQLQGRRVDAVAQAGGPRAVVEDVAQVAAAGRAHDLGPAHEERAVGLGVHRLGGRRLVERGPPGAGLELRVRVEQLRPAPRTPVRAGPMLVPQLPAERPLGVGVSASRCCID